METTPPVFRPLKAHAHDFEPHAIWPLLYRACKVCGKVVAQPNARS